jgi:uncharacterized protein
MNRIKKISATEDFVRDNMKEYDSGHDWYHIERVRKLAAYINEMEKLCDPFTLEIAVLLHDTADSKFNNDQVNGYRKIEDFMYKAGLAEIKDQVINAIRNVSFSSRKVTENDNDPLLNVLQDADRLDAIGAIGIARAFNYGGFRNNPIYIPVDESGNTIPSTISHFYDKLLKLKDLMKTSTGKRLAEERHHFLEIFLEQFYSEWESGVD